MRWIEKNDANGEFMSEPSDRLLILVATSLLATLPAGAEISTGGSFVLDRSLAIASSETMSDGRRFTLTGSAGGGYSPVTNGTQALKAPLKRLYSGFLPPLTADAGVGQTLFIDPGQTRVSIPAGAISQRYEVMVEADPIDVPIATPVSALQQATAQLAATFGSQFNAPATAVEVRILLADGTLLSGDSAASAAYQLDYKDRRDGGKVLVYHFDDTRGTWADVSSAVANGTAAQFSDEHTGLFAVFQQGPLDVGRAYAFPVPWRPHAGDAARYGTAQDGITFANIPSLGVIRIYTLLGELVREIDIPPGSVRLQWDARTAGGNDVASGVYVWSIESDGHRKTGKLMVIR